MYTSLLIYPVLILRMTNSFLYQDLPQQTDDKAENKTSVSSLQDQEERSSPDQSMKIAWRYQNQPKFQVYSYSLTFRNLPKVKPP